MATGPLPTVDASRPARATLLPSARSARGRGAYFPDPAGHGLEAVTRPYGGDPDSPLNGVTEEVPGAADG